MKEYRFRELLEVYLESRRSHVHEDFDNFYKGKLEALEKLFCIRFENPPFEFESMNLQYDDWAIWTFVEAAIFEYFQLTRSRGGEGGRGLYVLHLRREEHKYFEAVDAWAEAKESYRQASFNTLEQIFVALFGNLPQVFTSIDLLALGFDDNKEPDMSDYWDYV